MGTPRKASLQEPGRIFLYDFPCKQELKKELRHTPIGRKQGGAGRMPRMGGVGEGQLRVRKDKEAREALFVP